jgi:hypothetical protein
MLKPTSAITDVLGRFACVLALTKQIILKTDLVNLIK